MVMMFKQKEKEKRHDKTEPTSSQQTRPACRRPLRHVPANHGMTIRFTSLNAVVAHMLSFRRDFGMALASPFELRPRGRNGRATSKPNYEDDDDDESQADRQSESSVAGCHRS